MLLEYMVISSILRNEYPTWSSQVASASKSPRYIRLFDFIDSIKNGLFGLNILSEKSMFALQIGWIVHSDRTHYLISNFDDDLSISRIRIHYIICIFPRINWINYMYLYRFYGASVWIYVAAFLGRWKNIRIPVAPASGHKFSENYLLHLCIYLHVCAMCITIKFQNQPEFVWKLLFPLPR